MSRPITAIAAIAFNNVIGNQGGLPWRCPEDLRHFKATTKGKTVIMGRKTYESFGGPLPNRTHIVITRGSHRDARHAIGDSYVIKVSSLEEALDVAATFDHEIFVIGGGQIYEQALPLCNKLVISHIHTPAKGDAFFPQIDMTQFSAGRIDHRLEGSLPFTIVTYHRIEPI